MKSTTDDLNSARGIVHACLASLVLWSICAAILGAST